MIRSIYILTAKYLNENHDCANKSELAAKIGISGQDFYAFLSGKRIPKVMTFELIAKFFKTDLDKVKKEFEYMQDIEKKKAGI